MGFRAPAALLLVQLVLLQAALPASAQEVELKFYPEEVEGDYFEVGFSVSLTGSLGEFGSEALCALKAAVDWVNDRGGVFVKGIRYYVRLVYADDGSSHGERLLAVYEALYDRGVNLLLSPLPPSACPGGGEGLPLPGRRRGGHGELCSRQRGNDCGGQG